jgi:hypothetical protein
MKILSIDVGIKNLAYCLVNFENDEISIDSWDIINICQDKNLVCNEKLKKKNTPCGKKAKFCKYGINYCSIHSKNSEFLTPTNDLRILKKKLSNNKRIVHKKLIEFCKENDLEYLKIKKEVLIKNILKHFNSKYLDNIEKINANNLDMIDCGILLKKHLDKTFKNKKIDKIIIENQIGPLALRMKMIQGMITQHFIEKKLENIDLVNASNKLKHFLKGKKTTYNERKKLGIELTRNMLQTETILNKWLEYFNKNPKKDDLADSYLQCLWYINYVIRKK